MEAEPGHLGRAVSVVAKGEQNVATSGGGLCPLPCSEGLSWEARGWEETLPPGSLPFHRS